MAWASSDRRARLPKDWHKRRARAKREAGGRCQWIISMTGTRCHKYGTDCDHIDRNGGDEASNLQWLCREHHKEKTQAEAMAARSARRSRRRPPERHPGLL